MAIKTSQVRQAIRDQVLQIAGMHELPFPGEYIGRTQNSKAHKGFAVTVQSTNSKEDRQRRAVGYYLQTTARVIFCHRLRPKDVNTSLDNALDLEEQIIIQVLQSYSAIRPGLEIRYNRSVRTIDDTIEWLISDSEYTIFHHTGV